ncbi:hypothetical protein SBV1_220029 [Verrucomicrobia bacterium]|nr:hypothetical protein SBV1_220029 [Verrucomicrobiota bacterium]
MPKREKRQIVSPLKISATGTNVNANVNFFQG